MSLIMAIILGIIQGLTEFFPISSSTHITIARLFLHFHELPKIFDLCCHLGTLLSLFLFFKTEIRELFTIDRKKIPHFIFALVPLIPFYFILKPLRHFTLDSSFLGLFLILTSGMLFLAGFLRFPRMKPNILRDVILIGTMQSMALIPGISRSASTISCAHVLGWSTKEAVRFSFLLSIPTILGGNLMECILYYKEFIQLFSLECFVGFITSFLVGGIMIRFAMRFLEKGNLRPFAWYCLVLGIIISTVC